MPCSKTDECNIKGFYKLHNAQVTVIETTAKHAQPYCVQDTSSTVLWPYHILLMLYKGLQVEAIPVQGHPHLLESIVSKECKEIENIAKNMLF